MVSAVRRMTRLSASALSMAAALTASRPPTDRTLPDVTSLMTSRRLRLPLPGRVRELF